MQPDAHDPFFEVPDAAGVRANRAWWDAAAADYQQTHAATLGRAHFVWGPEGLREDEAQLLGPVAGRRILEIGCGAAQCTRALHAWGAQAVGLDIARGQLAQARRLDGATPSALVEAHAGALPFAGNTFDAAFAAYGALQFVGDAAGVLAEVARVLKPGGRWVFSITHPIRWAFPDDPGPEGLTVSRSYFDTRAYAELDAAGTVTYAEYHRTLGQWIDLLGAAGFRLTRLVEPEWPGPDQPDWDGWSRLRGALIPGTAIFCCDKVAPGAETVPSPSDAAGSASSAAG